MRRWLEEIEYYKALPRPPRIGRVVVQLTRVAAFTRDMLCTCLEYIDTRADRGIRTTISQMQTHLIDEHGEEVTGRVIVAALRAAGYTYHKLPNIWKKGVARQEAIRLYLIELDKHLRDDNSVLVFMDESYVWTNIRAEYGWGKPRETRLTKVSTGNRITVVDAMTKDGLFNLDVDAFTSLDFGEDRNCTLLAFKHKA